MRAYRIVDWQKTYQKSDLKKTVNWTWVAFPIKHDGAGYRRVVALPNSVNVMLGFVLMVQVAAKCPTRGLLSNADGPLTPDDLAAKTGFPQEIFAEAMDALSDPARKIRWLELVEYRDDGDSLDVIGVAEPAEPPAEAEPLPTPPDAAPMRPEASGEPRLFREPPAPVPQAPERPEYPVFPTCGKAKTWELTPADIGTLRQSFPAMDIEGECRKAWGWIVANQSNRKTAKGMLRFLVGWMSRANDRPRNGVNHGNNANLPRQRRTAEERGEHPENFAVPVLQ